jgi:hypothetical protein
MEGLNLIPRQVWKLFELRTKGEKLSPEPILDVGILREQK